MIPARGTVEFLVYALCDDPHPDIIIIGADCWRRPVVGLIERDWDSIGRELNYEPVVVDEIGLCLTVTDYLTEIMGGLHWDHASATYQPHIDGPVDDAPRIKQVVDSATLGGVPCPR